MNIDVEKLLKDKWASLDPIDKSSRLVDKLHPVEWYVQFNYPNNKSLLMISTTKIPNIKSSADIDVTYYRRSDDRYAISFKLTNNNHFDVFVTMAADLIVYSKKSDSAAEANRKLAYRYNCWLKLLANNRNGKLSVNQQKGLIGELTFLKGNLDSTNSRRTLMGWVGPDGYDQDFVYTDIWYEVKSTSISSNSIKISSLEQLSRDNLGHLILYRIDKCPETEKNAVNLYELVESIIHILTQYAQDMIPTFEDKLNKAGYIHSVEYTRTSFLISSRQDYKVSDTFPRIRREDLPASIVAAEYLLDIASIDKWKI